MRLFIALDFSKQVKDKLFSIGKQLKACSTGGRFLEPEKLHLTLVFLGECNEEQTEAVKKVMDEIRFKPIPIVFDRISHFKRRDGDIYWAGIKSEKSLINLQRKLESVLEDAGFLPESHIFTPHVTLARDVRGTLTPWQISEFGESVKSIKLMRSWYRENKLTYTTIYERKYNDGD